MTRLDLLCDMTVPLVDFALQKSYKVHYEGKLPKGPSIIFAKHQGQLDQFLIGVMLKRQTGQLANYTMRNFNFPFNYFLQAGGGILVVRSQDARNSRYGREKREEINSRATKYAISRLKLGEPLVIFPEGTRAYKKLQIPFKMGMTEEILKKFACKLVSLGIEYEDYSKLHTNIWVRAGEPFYASKTSELEEHLKKELPRLSGINSTDNS